MKTTLALLISIVLSAWIFLYSPVSANATNHDANQAEGFLTGTITDQQSGLPIAGIQVQVWQQGFSDVHTNAQGQYQISHPEGEYRIAFFDETGTYISEWYDNASSYEAATLIQVKAGQTTEVDTQLDKGGMISGSVSLDTPMPPKSYLDFYAYNVLSPTSWQDWDLFYGPGTGPYRISQLPTGTYKIKSYYIVYNSYVPDYAIAYYDLKLTFSEASNVNVLEGVTTSLDIDLTQLGQICGTITDYYTLQPVPNLFEVHAVNNGETVATAHTDTGGHYCLSHLIPGNYAVVFTGAFWPEECIVYCTPSHLYQAQQFPDIIALARGQVISGIDAIVAPYKIFMPLVTK